jgi:hypothetical protein
VPLSPLENPLLNPEANPSFGFYRPLQGTAHEALVSRYANPHVF